MFTYLLRLSVGEKFKSDKSLKCTTIMQPQKVRKVHY